MNIITYIETKEGKAVTAGLELIAAAAAAGAAADAVLIGSDLDHAAAEAAADGAASVHVIDAVEEMLTEDVITDLLAQYAAKKDCHVILLPATLSGKILTPRLAGALDAASVNDAVRLEAEGNVLRLTRPAYAGTVLEQLHVEGPVVISLRSGSYNRPDHSAEHPAAPEHITLQPAEEALRNQIAERIAEAGEAVNLEEASVIVTGGRGMGDAEQFALCGQLAEVLGGVVGATRPAIESGWISRTHQVGQSGKIVAPDLYIACGVSGATQHLSGMTGSKYIVAINKDEDAPIFSVADVGIVGDVKKILPLLIEEMKKKKQAE